MRFLYLTLATTLAAATVSAPSIVFEKEAQAMHGGKASKSLKLLSRRAQGLVGIYAAPTERGGADLYFVASNDLGETWTEPQRINNVPGEVSDHGENSAQLFFSPDEMTLYAFWNTRDPKGGSHVRFSRGAAMMTTWSPAVTVDDDPLPNSHGFQGAGVGPDGTLYAAWLDMREKEESKTGEYTAGAAAVYLTRSSDGGKTWSKNVRISRDVCPCCRAAFGFTGGRVVVAWRGVENGDMRDIHTAWSADSGVTWSKPAPVHRDNWKIKGCPHVGPSLATVGDKLYVVWFSEAGGKPGIYYASTTNGERYTARQSFSEGTTDPSHPFVASSENRLAVAFKARDAKDKDGWGKSNIYYRELLPGGTLTPLSKAGVPGEGSVANPALTLGMSGRTIVSWTESQRDKGPRAMFVRGRLR